MRRAPESWGAGVCQTAGATKRRMSTRDSREKTPEHGRETARSAGAAEANPTRAGRGGAPPDYRVPSLVKASWATSPPAAVVSRSGASSVAASFPAVAGNRSISSARIVWS